MTNPNRIKGIPIDIDRLPYRQGDDYTFSFGDEDLTLFNLFKLSAEELCGGKIDIKKNLPKVKVSSKEKRIAMEQLMFFEDDPAALKIMHSIANKMTSLRGPVLLGSTSVDVKVEKNGVVCPISFSSYREIPDHLSMQIRWGFYYLKGKPQTITEKTDSDGVLTCTLEGKRPYIDQFYNTFVTPLTHD